jgi:hypothetical protein
MAELEDSLARMRGAWIAGRSGLEHAPADWRTLLGEGPAAEAALTALAGQALQAVFRTVGPEALQPRPLLPRLSAPTPSPAARARFRRALAARKTEAGGVRPLIALLAARGYAAHPADWTPGPNDDWAPDLYAPWIAWAAAERTTVPQDELTAETWNDWPWAERRVALAALRRRDPAAASALLVARAAGEPAEKRLKLLELLNDGLGPADIPLLTSLTNDRSDRVQALVKHLLARLGHGAADKELAAELAKMVELGKVGLLRRKPQLRLPGLKTAAQQARRRDLFGLVTLAGLAKALGADEAALVETAPTGDTTAILAFATMVADTGSDAARRALLERLLDDDGAPVGLVTPLAARADAAERQAALARVAARDTSGTFSHSLVFAGEALGALPFKAISGGAGQKALFGFIHQAQTAEGYARQHPDQQARLGLSALGLLLDAPGAQALIDACAQAGLSPADPRLDILHLNVALKPERMP